MKTQSVLLSNAVDHFITLFEFFDRFTFTFCTIILLIFFQYFFAYFSKLVLRNVNGQKIYRIRKNIIQLFKDSSFLIDIETNTRFSLEFLIFDKNNLS